MVLRKDDKCLSLVDRVFKKIMLGRRWKLDFGGLRGKRELRKVK